MNQLKKSDPQVSKRLQKVEKVLANDPEEKCEVKLHLLQAISPFPSEIPNRI